MMQIIAQNDTGLLGKTDVSQIFVSEEAHI